MLKKQYLKNKPTCKVTFSLPKEAVNGGSEVRVLGEFNNWTWEQGVPMKAAKAEYKASVELDAGRQYEFRYLIDGTTWVNDWAADAYLATPYGVENCVVALEEVMVTAAPKKAAPKKKATPVAAKAPAKKAATKKPATKKVAPKAAKKDDLKKIEGIGPKIAQILQENGIKTFADLGKAKITSLRKFLAEAGPRYKMHEPRTWPKQAKLAAKGDWEKLTKLQDELKGGK
ncbi:MAG: 50S ribosomal protein L27 [Saprospiraceae bacterium]|nr:50S ribosomal protein L27 [Saprospiraceae bacterium]